MREDELITRVRRDARIRTAHPDYTDAVIREELWDMLCGTFAESVQRAQGGYWRQKSEISVTANARAARIPHRALAQTADMVEYLAGSGTWVPLVDLQSTRYRGNLETATAAYPTHFLVDGDFVELYPLVNQAVTLRISYMLRPPALVQFQTAGQIQSVNLSTRQVVVDAIPVDRVNGGNVDGTYGIDVVSSTGGHELHLIGASGAPTSLTYTFDAGTDLSRLVVGDYIRGPDQSEWPMLHKEYHATLAAAEAASICLSLGKHVKAQQLASKVASDLARMTNVQEPRIKDVHKYLKRNYGEARRRRRWSRRFGKATV